MSKLYALINKDNEIIEQRIDIDDNVVTKPGYRWLKIINIPPPKYDPNKFFLRGPELVVEPDCVRQYWMLLEKTDLDREKELIQKINAIDPIILQVLNSFGNQLNGTSLTVDEFKEQILKMVRNV